MRLLNSSTLQLKEFPANQIPVYAILSHTWGEEEVLFADIIFADIRGDSAEDKAGYEKIRYCCKQAAAHGLDYVWIDTCCIDKSSSAELSEAINSMYSWYQKAWICYAYLADVPTHPNTKISHSAFANSRWFKRGWTLQELIGPSDVVFFSQEWVQIGTKATLQNTLAEITGIDVGILTGVKGLESASVAKRMSWASHRAVTRTEDIAYCLMGLFDVNMPMLYGEGEKAFIRLQEEIMKGSDDQSLLAWTDPTAPADSLHGLLAKSPADFVNSGNIMPYRDWELSAPFSMSNKGLRIELHLSRYKEDIYVAALDCTVPPEYEGFIGIYLKRLPTGEQQYARVKPQTLCKVAARGSVGTIYVRNSVLGPGPEDIYPVHAFQLRNCPARGEGYELIKVISSSSRLVPRVRLSAYTGAWTGAWTGARMPFTFKISKVTGQVAGAILLKHIDGESLVISLGSTTDFGVGFDVKLADIERFEKLQKVFNPRAPGTNMVAGNHQVRVNAESQIHAGIKYYMVDIVVEAIPQAPDPINMIEDLIPGLQSQPDKRPPNHILTPSRGLEKLKHLFKSS